MLALHLDNLLFLLFVAVAILFQLLTRAASKTGRRTGTDQKRRSTSAAPLKREETDEDRIRKFLEALGQPTTSKPPPPVAPRPTYQKPIVIPRPEQKPVTRTILSPLPPLATRPPDLPTETQLPPEPMPPSEPIPEAEIRVAFEPTTPPISKQMEAKTDITTLLRSTSGLRQAILLREIFGPPRSLQPLDLVGTV
jgi:hypothetical protein